MKTQVVLLTTLLGVQNIFSLKDFKCCENHAFIFCCDRGFKNVLIAPTTWPHDRTKGFKAFEVFFFESLALRGTIEIWRLSWLKARAFGPNARLQKHEMTTPDKKNGDLRFVEKGQRPTTKDRQACCALCRMLDCK